MRADREVRPCHLHARSRARLEPPAGLLLVPIEPASGNSLIILQTKTDLQLPSSGIGVALLKVSNQMTSPPRDRSFVWVINPAWPFLRQSPSV